MKQYQTQTIKMSLEEEKKVLNSLKKEYAEAKKQVKKKIDDLMSRGDANLPNVIHQVKYQKAIESQIDEALNKLKSGEYQTISDYLEESYGTGFTSSLYRLQKQGIPLIFPMDRNEIIKAVQLNSKISGGLYKRLGINTKAMKNAIRQEVTRGISSSMSSADIARNIDNRMNSGLYNSYRIARTEGHRINQEASFDAMKKAKDAGADVVKQWDSTLDGRTRPHHRMLDGQIRELEDPFEVDGLQAQYPSGFGKASEDINCRCLVLEIGRWELDEDDTFTKFDGNRSVIVKDLSNSKSFEEFRKKYNIEVKKKEVNAIKTVANVKDYNELSDYLLKNYNIKLEKSVTSLDFDVVKESIEGVDLIINQFPELKTSLKYIKTSSSGVMSCSGDTINFNPKYYDNPNVIRDACLRCSDSGWWVKNASPKSIGSHETAHGIEWLLIELNETDYGDGLSIISRYNRREAWSKCTEAKKIVSEACKNIKKTPYGKDKIFRELKQAISEYANTNPSETLAEAFADVTANGDNANPLSLEIKRLTIKQYNDYKLNKGVQSP